MTKCCLSRLTAILIMSTVRFLKNAFLSPLLPVAVVGTALGSLAFFSGPAPEAVKSSAETEHGISAPIVPASYVPAEADIQELLGMTEKAPEAEKAVAQAEEKPEPEVYVKGSPRHEVAVYINRSFRVPLREARQITDWAVEIGEARDLDPLLILAVIGTESSYRPNARSGAGAEGLMQVMTKVHAEKFKAFGGVEAAFDPYANIVVGTDILIGLIKRTGSVGNALKWYCGAANHNTDYGYAARVLKEHGLLSVAAKGDSNAAVQLSRAKKRAPEEAEKTARHLGFSRWTSLCENRPAARAHTADLNSIETAAN